MTAIVYIFKFVKYTYDSMYDSRLELFEIENYICDVIRFWVSEFDVDGIRLDAADVLDFDFMKALRGRWRIRFRSPW